MKLTAKRCFSVMLAGLMMTGCASGGFNPSDSIGVITREDGSGTRSAFAELFDLEEKQEDGTVIDHTSANANVTSSTAVMLTTVSDDPASIGYVSLGSLNDTVKAVSIDGALPSAQNIENSTYKIYRPFILVTRKEGISEPAQDFLNFILSEKGQNVAAKNGYVPLSDPAPWTPGGLSGKVTVSGSSSVTPLMEKIKEAYEKENSNIKVEIQQSDSSTGIADAAAGTCDIGMSSRELKQSESDKGVQGQVMANDGIAVIVSLDNPIENLSVQQVRDIYTGETKTWSELD